MCGQQLNLRCFLTFDILELKCFSLFSLISLLVISSSFPFISKGQEPGSPSKLRIGHDCNSTKTGLLSLKIEYKYFNKILN